MIILPLHSSEQHPLTKRTKADDELEMPVLGNLEWGRSEDLRSKEHWPAVVLVAQKKEAPQSSGKKKN